MRDKILGAATAVSGIVLAFWVIGRFHDEVATDCNGTDHLLFRVASMLVALAALVGPSLVAGLIQRKLRTKLKIAQEDLRSAKNSVAQAMWSVAFASSDWASRRNIEPISSELRKVLDVLCEQERKLH